MRKQEKKDHQQHRLKAFLIEFRMVFNKLHPIEFQIDVIGPFSFSSFSKVLKNYSEFLDLISFTKQIVSKNQTKLRYHAPQKMKFPLRISSVDVTKSAVSQYLQEKTCAGVSF